MNNLALRTLTNDISIKYFGKKITCPIRFNYRLRTTGGRFFYNRLFTNQHQRIEINPKMLTEHNKGVLIGTIKHELCHYHIWNTFHRRGHGTLFKAVNERIGGLNRAPVAKKELRPLLKYRCQKCGAIIIRRNHVNTNRYRCGKCQGKLKLIGKISINNVEKKVQKIEANL